MGLTYAQASERQSNLFSADIVEFVVDDGVFGCLAADDEGALAVGWRRR